MTHMHADNLIDSVEKAQSNKAFFGYQSVIGQESLSRATETR